MNKIVDRFHLELIETILKTNNKEEILEFEKILEKRKEWIDSYNNDDKSEVLQYILEKDTELKKTLEEKMKTLREKLLQEETFNKNREAYKLYE